MWHLGPAVVLQLDNLVGCQPLQGLAHHRARDTEALRELFFSQPQARRQAAFHDGLVDAVVDPARGRVGGLGAVQARRRHSATRATVRPITPNEMAVVTVPRA